VTGAAAAAEEFSVTATLYFPAENRDDLQPKVARILEHVRAALDADPGAGTESADLLLSWRGAGEFPLEHLDAPAGYPSAVDVLLTARAGAVADAP